jgi:hypothetical protein
MFLVFSEPEQKAMPVTLPVTTHEGRHETLRLMQYFATAGQQLPLTFILIKIFTPKSVMRLFNSCHNK